MSKPSVLLGNELGLGIGYSVHLREIATHLQNQSIRPIVAIRSLDFANQLFQDCSFPCIQAPYIVGRVPNEALNHGFTPTGFADLMACNGFGSIDHLYAMLRGWRDLIDLVKPDLIVANYAPLLTLAAYGRIPAVVFGPAYVTPPANQEFFPCLPNTHAPLANQIQLLETIRSVQKRFAAPLPEQITEVYRGQARIVTTLPELDPYREFRPEECFGMFDLISPPEPLKPENSEKYYAYLTDEDWLTEKIQTELVQSELPGTIYLRDQNDETIKTQASCSARFLLDPPQLEKMTKHSSVIIHHGGAGTTHAALAAGRPQILVPRLLDQFLTAEAVTNFPYITVIDNAEKLDGLAKEVQRLASDGHTNNAAMEFAWSIQTRNLHNSKQRIVDACLECLGK